MTVQPDGQQPDRRKLSGGAIASLTGVAVLVIFIIQNTERVRFQSNDRRWPVSLAELPD